MVRVTIELWPHGDEKTKRTLGVMNIINVGTGSYEVGNYSVELYEGPSATKERLWELGHVRGWPRKSRHVFHLVRAAIESALPDKEVS